MGVVHGVKEDNDRQPVRVDDEGRVYITTNPATPLEVRATSAIPVTTETSEGIAQTHEVSNSKTITASSQSAVLPEENGYYMLQARGGDVFIETASGSAPTVTASVGGYSLMVMDGDTHTIRLTGDYIAWIGAVAGGSFVICHLDRS
jgi:hypothetical protein